MGVVWAFVAISAFAALAWAFACFLGNVKFGEGSGPDEDGSQNVVTKEIYLWTLLRGRRTCDGDGNLRLESSQGMESQKTAS